MPIAMQIHEPAGKVHYDSVSRVGKRRIMRTMARYSRIFGQKHIKEALNEH